MTAPYSAKAVEKLLESVEYEALLLEEVYKITDLQLKYELPDSLVYPLNCETNTYTIYGRCNQILGDWRPDFLQAGAPLIFVTSFKLLDMLIEWVLCQNDKTRTFRFEQKIQAIKGSIQFPKIIVSRKWLRDRIVALYEHLEPLRGTIIHARHFKSENGTMQVSSSKKGNVGPAKILCPDDLRNLVVIFLTLIRCIEGAWTIDSYREKSLRFALDKLSHLHELPSLGQQTPLYINARFYLSETKVIDIDIAKIRRDITGHCPNNDVVFNLRIILVTSGSDKTTAYLIPWEMLQNYESSFRIPCNDLAEYSVSLPPDLGG